MAQRLKRWESPRREGRNNKGKGGSARQRQRQKQMQALRRKLKQQADEQKGGRDSFLFPFLFALFHLPIPSSRKRRAKDLQGRSNQDFHIKSA